MEWFGKLWKKKFFDGVPNSPKFSMGDAWFSSDLLENLGNIFFSLSFFHFVLDHFKEGGLEKRQNTVLASIIIIQAIITICFSLSSSAKHTFRGLYFNEGWKKCLLHIFFFLKSKHQCSFPMNMHDSTDKMTVECLSLSIWPLFVKKKEFPLLIMIFIFSTTKLMMTRGHRLCVVLQHNRRQQNHDDVKAMGKLIRKIWFDFVHHGCSSETSHRTFSKRSYTYIQ